MSIYKRLAPFFVLILLLGTFAPARADEYEPPTATSTPKATATLKLSATPTLTATLPAGVTAIPTLTPTAGPPTATPYPVVIPLIIHEPTPVGYGPDEFDFGINPLTGLMVDDPARLERRPMAIKVTNYPRYVRPQPGLSKADIVFEYYMERLSLIHI